MCEYNSYAVMKRDGIKYFLSEQSKNYGSGNTWLSEGFCWGRAAE